VYVRARGWGCGSLTHLTLNDSLRTAEIDGREMDEKDPWEPFLSSAAYAIRYKFHTTLQETPGQLVFGRDMVLPITFMADWGAIEQQRQKEMGRNNRRENASRISHDYKVGDKVLLKNQVAPRTGPHTVASIYTNGRLCIQKGKVNERVNIRILFPYFENAGH
jgi:hypothetical protein